MSAIMQEEPHDQSVTESEQSDDDQSETIADVASKKALEQINGLMPKLLSNVYVIPYYYEQSSCASYWIAPYYPMLFHDAIAWLDEEIRVQATNSLSIIKEPTVRIVPSRGYIDYITRHPDLPESTMFH